jgi:hypothetical protein
VDGIGVKNWGGGRGGGEENRFGDSCFQLMTMNTRLFTIFYGKEVSVEKLRPLKLSLSHFFAIFHNELFERNYKSFE